MRILAFSRIAVGISASAALLAGCGGSQPPIGAPGAMSIPNKNGNAGALVYAAEALTGSVYVYTYPQLKIVEKLGTLNRYAGGECNDSNGDVFITTSSSSDVGTIFEYMHGGSKPIETLSDPGVPYGCSVDPMTGNLAVSNISDKSNPYGNDGDVAVYEEAQGTPTMYYESSIFYLLYCGYDNAGNLYADGSNASGHVLYELSSGSSQLTEINLDPTVKYPGALQWDGKQMTIIDYQSVLNLRHPPLTVDRLEISGGNAKVTGSTSLSSRMNRYNGQTWIQGGSILGIINKGATGLAIWKYSAGGNPVHQNGKAGEQVAGVVLSEAQ